MSKRVLPCPVCEREPIEKDSMGIKCPEIKCPMSYIWWEGATWNRRPLWHELQILRAREKDDR